MEKDQLEMSSRDRDVLKVMQGILNGTRSHVEAGRLLRRCPRQVSRIRQALLARGDAAVIHGLRGRPSNAAKGELKARALAVYRQKLAGLGPTLAAEKLAELGDDQGVIAVPRETLRRWLLEAGLWKASRKRDVHRRRRERRACFGEMLQADASEHDWLEGRGPTLTLVGLIDDATDRVLLRFYPSETTFAYMDLLRRWIGGPGVPRSWYSDRHGIFWAEAKVPGYDELRRVPTQFSRAMGELGIELIPAYSPQAKGRVERLWGTAQDRLVKELRLAGARTIEEANAVLDRTFAPWFNRRCVNAPASANDAHRMLDRKLNLAAILSHQETRCVGNDYTISYRGRVYQLLPPAWPGLRRGQVIVEERLDGSLHIRFRARYLKFAEFQAPRPAAEAAPGALPPDPRSLSNEPIPAEAGKPKVSQCKRKGRDVARPGAEAEASAVHRSGGHSGRTPALPCLPAGEGSGTVSSRWRPPPSHPWRNPAKRQADISIGRK